MTSWFLSWICELDATHIFYSCQQTEVQKKKIHIIMSICTEKGFSKIQHLIFFLKRFIYL